MPATDFLLRKTLGSKTACPHAKTEGWLANAHCQLVLSTTTPEHVFLRFVWSFARVYLGLLRFYWDLSEGWPIFGIWVGSLLSFYGILIGTY